MKGFTLIELMVVVLILSILIAISIPTYREYVSLGYGASAMRAITLNTLHLQMCILDSGSCDAINTLVASDSRWQSTPNPLVSNTSAVLTYKNEVCQVSVNITSNGGLSYSADTLDSFKATKDQCEQGAGLK